LDANILSSADALDASSITHKLKPTDKAVLNHLRHYVIKKLCYFEVDKVLVIGSLKTPDSATFSAKSGNEQ
jgi:hypothetical protein